MRVFLVVVVVFFSTHFFSQTQQDFFSQTNEFLKNNVTTEGKIKYSSLKKSPGELFYILKNVETLKIDSLSNETKIAFWINAYNLLVIKNVIDNYPVRSINLLEDFFSKRFQIANAQYSLSEIENRVKSLVADPGRHFVLSDSTISGQKLLNAAYLPDSVLYQLQYEMKTAINKPDFFKIISDSNSIELPSLFQLHKEDFVTLYFNQIDFLNVFLDKKLDKKLVILFKKYNWALNEL